MLKKDEQRLLVKLATLYYVDGLKQSQIAKQLDLSQSFVSRALTRCTKEGVVKISVVQPANVYLELEAQIQASFGITQAIVVDVQEASNEAQIKQAIGSAAAHYIQNSLSANDLVGISSWSSTIRAMVEHMHPQKVKASGVVQTLGGVGINGNVQATLLTHSLANVLNCSPYLLPAQSIERTADYKNYLMETDELSDVVDMFKNIDISIVGIGMLAPSQLLKNSGNYYNEDMLQKLSDRGAVGDICLRYFDSNGESVLSEEEDPVIGMQLDALKKCPRVVALAGGIEKAKAIKGALTGGYVDILIIDQATAREIIKTL